MSHFPVTVCLPPIERERVADALKAALAPFDENTEVASYRAYIENWQEKYQRAQEYYADKPQELPRPIADMDVAGVLSEYEDEKIHTETKEGSDVVLYYRESTYNPKSKWDWWVIGGRWLGYFTVKPEHDGDKRLITGEAGALGNKGERGRVDGGPRGLLDFDALRKAKATEAGDIYDRWTKLVDGLPEAKPWAHFLALRTPTRRPTRSTGPAASTAPRPASRPPSSPRTSAGTTTSSPSSRTTAPPTRSGPPRPPSPASPCSTWKDAGWSPATWAGSG